MHERQLKQRSSGEISRIGITQLCHRVHYYRTVDRRSSNGATNTWVDELLVLHPAAVCADQLHPRPA